MKRIVSALSALLLLFAFLPAAASAETYENLTYTVSDGKVTITDCADSVTGAVVIPATIEGCPVTTIAMSAFEGCTGLTAITIGQNVTSVGVRAFSGCSALAAITVAEGNSVYHSAGNCLIETSSKTLIAGCKDSVIPADGTVTAIGRLAFYNCDGLTAVTVPNQILSIGDSAFEKCAQLASVNLGSGVTSIGNSAFLGCTALKEIAIPDSVKTMGVYVFSGCSKLASVTIGNLLSTISNFTFDGCTALTDVTFGSSVVTIGRFAFTGCSELKEIVIPNGVTTIDKFAFYNCAALESVYIPESVSAIGNDAFSGCTNVCLLIREANTYAITYARNNGIDYTALGRGNLAITTVTLKSSAVGVYFGSNLSWAASDPEIAAYGIALSTENPVPVADDSDPTSLYTQGNTSVLVKDILKTGNTVAENAVNATAKIYARVYVRLTSGEYLYGEVVQANLRQVVTGADQKWDQLSEAQQGALKQLYTTYYDVMRGWSLPNIKNA